MQVCGEAVVDVAWKVQTGQLQPKRLTLIITIGFKMVSRIPNCGLNDIYICILWLRLVGSFGDVCGGTL